MKVDKAASISGFYASFSCHAACIFLFKYRINVDTASMVI